MRTTIASLMGVLLVWSCAYQTAQAHSGHTDWGEWRFDWAVEDAAGIALKQVTYRDILIFKEASMPVIRVRYDGDPVGCGPFADQFTWDRMLSWEWAWTNDSKGRHGDEAPPGCGPGKICQRSFTDGAGRVWLEVSAYARIGAYRLVQRWLLSTDGYLQGFLLSRGLSCDYDHDHHPYWRFDFDLGQAEWNRVSEHNLVETTAYAKEALYEKAAAGRVWRVRDQRNGHVVELTPGLHDGAPDHSHYGGVPFASQTAAVLRYKPNEEAWNVGEDLQQGDHNFLDDAWVAPAEPLLAPSVGGLPGTPLDTVFWYIAHLRHHAAEGDEQWHAAGPTLLVKINEPPAVAITEPHYGATVPAGAPLVFEAHANDPEDGQNCCTIRWWTMPGSPQKLLGKKVDMAVTPGADGKAIVFAQAVDSGGRASQAVSVVLSVTNDPPVAKIVTPVGNSTVVADSPIMLFGTCTDINQFGGMDESAASWQIQPPLASPVPNGYDNVIKIPGPPPASRKVILTCTDILGVKSAPAEVTVQVVPGTPNAAPAVAIVKPHPDQLLKAETPFTLVAEVTENDGDGVALRWLIGTGKKAKLIGTGNNLVWTPSTHVPQPGEPVVLMVQAQDKDGVDTAFVNVTVFWPPN